MSLPCLRHFGVITQIELPFVVDQPKLDAIEPTLPAQYVSIEAGICCKIDRTVELKIQDRKSYRMAVSHKISHNGGDRLARTALDIEPKLFPMQSSENTQARSRIQLRFELGNSVAQHQQHRQSDPVPPGIVPVQAGE